MTRIALVLGTRPQIVKSAPLIQEFRKHNDLELEVIHTGQHYDNEMSKLFFEELELPIPAINLEVGSGSQARQTAEVMLRLENVLGGMEPKAVIIPGDTNSALGGALAASKMGFPVMHMESGARSHDMRMAEELNRRLIDHCSRTLFAPTKNCVKNLKHESVPGSVYLTGDSMYDAYLKYVKKAQRVQLPYQIGLDERKYALMTLHRAENVDNRDRLAEIIDGVSGSNLPIVFPLHPRTKKRLAELNIEVSENDNMKVTEPLGYLETLKALGQARMVLTDSGGLQKEAFWSKVPCITMRDVTEWTETTDMRVNFLVGAEKRKIRRAMRAVDDSFDDIAKRFVANPFGDGNAAGRMVEIISQQVEI